MAKRIWCAYNHIPGGQMVATWFETTKLKKMIGEGKTEDFTFQAEEKLQNFMRSDFVAMYLNGQLIKHKVVVYPTDRDLADVQDPAGEVLRYAYEQGLRPYLTPGERKELPVDPESKKQITDLRTDVDAMKSDIHNIKAGQDAILAAIKGLAPTKPVFEEAPAAKEGDNA